MMTISAPSRIAGIWSAVMSALRLMRMAGSPSLRCRSKISASDPLASTKTPRTDISVCLQIEAWSGSDARKRQHGMHQNVGARRAIDLRRVFQLVMADAVLAGHEHHCCRHHGIEIAGIMAGAGGDAPVRIAERLGGVLHRVDQSGIEMGRRLAPDHIELDLDLAPRRDLGRC